MARKLPVVARREGEGQVTIALPISRTGPQWFLLAGLKYTQDHPCSLHLSGRAFHSGWPYDHVDVGLWFDVVHQPEP